MLSGFPGVKSFALRYKTVELTVSAAIIIIIIMAGYIPSM